MLEIHERSQSSQKFEVYPVTGDLVLQAVRFKLKKTYLQQFDNIASISHVFTIEDQNFSGIKEIYGRFFDLATSIKEALRQRILTQSNFINPVSV